MKVSLRGLYHQPKTLLCGPASGHHALRSVVVAFTKGQGPSHATKHSRGPEGMPEGLLSLDEEPAVGLEVIKAARAVEAAAQKVKPGQADQSAALADAVEEALPAFKGCKPGTRSSRSAKADMPEGLLSLDEEPAVGLEAIQAAGAAEAAAEKKKIGRNDQAAALADGVEEAIPAFKARRPSSVSKAVPKRGRSPDIVDMPEGLLSLDEEPVVGLAAIQAARAAEIAASSKIGRGVAAAADRVEEALPAFKASKRGTGHGRTAQGAGAGADA